MSVSKSLQGTVLYDDNGTPVAVIQDNNIYRVETRSTLAGQVAKAGAEQKVTTIADESNPTTEHRLQTEARLAPGSKVTVVPPTTGDDVGNVFRQFLTDDGTAGGDPDMIVNGGGTPVPFWVPADATDDLVLYELRFVFAAFQLDWSGAFGKGGGILTNGVEIIVTSNGGTVSNIAKIGERPIVRNDELLMLPSRSDVTLSQDGNRDVLALSVDFGGAVVLVGGSGDEVRVIINDNLTTGARDITFFEFAVFGVRMVP